MAGGLFALSGARSWPSGAYVDCIAVSLLAAGVLTLVGGGLRRPALVLAVVYGVARGGMAGGRWNVVLADWFVGLGLLVVAEVFVELERRGLRLGKFLVVGPLLGGVLFAAAPLAEWQRLLMFDAVRPLLEQLLLGIVIGNGAGLGVELAALAGQRAPSPETARAWARR